MYSENHHAGDKDLPSSATTSKGSIGTDVDKLPPFDYQTTLPLLELPLGAHPTLPEFRAVKTYEDLVELYEKRGITFSDTKELVKRVANDWGKEKFRIFEDISEASLPNEFPHLKLEIGDERYKIYGCHHVGEAYYQLLLDAVSRNPWWLHEENLGTKGGFLPGLERYSVEIDDQNAKGILSRILIDVALMIPRGIKTINALRKIKALEGRESGPSTPETFFERTLNLPLDFSHDLPANIDLILREKLEVGFSYNLARSAYQAAFLKAWDPIEAHPDSEQYLESPSFAPETLHEKCILVGSSHVHEIEYFLTHEPAVLESVRERATRDAELCNRDVERFFRRREVQDTIVSFGTPLVGGALTYGVLHALFHLL
jgi:hypothetical protein